jgi:hypothetical protein
MLWLSVFCLNRKWKGKLKFEKKKTRICMFQCILHHFYILKNIFNEKHNLWKVKYLYLYFKGEETIYLKIKLRRLKYTKVKKRT